MWNYDESKKAYINGNQVLRFHRSASRNSKGGKLRNASDTKYRLYVETYSVNEVTGIGGDSTIILEKTIKGEGMEANKRIETHEDKIRKYALDNYKIENIIWNR